MKKLLLAILILFTNQLYAQQRDCSCSDALDKLIAKVELEYPGFADKTQPKAEYNSFLKNLKKEALLVDNRKCENVLKQYTAFFKDPHLWVGTKESSVNTPKSATKSSTAINQAEFEKSISKSKDSLEGVWSTDGYRIGVKKVNENEYRGFIIEAQASVWKPGDLKFVANTDGQFEYIVMDKSVKKGHYVSFGQSILHFDEIGVTLVKQFPKSSMSELEIAQKLKELQGFYFRNITSKTAYLKLPSFEYAYVDEINKLIDENSQALENTENLIIDVRGNPGGTTDAFEKLLPYISGKSIRHTTAEFLATETYIQNLERYKNGLKTDSAKANTDRNIRRLKENLGKFVNYTATGAPVYIQEIKTAVRSPKNVVVLANKASGSSAEYFLFIAKQSKKVKIMGIPSYGALDYGNAYLVDFGCPTYQVFMPTYRAMRLPEYPIDNIGIQPDMYIDKSVKDWIGFAVDYLEKE